MPLVDRLLKWARPSKAPKKPKRVLQGSMTVAELVEEGRRLQRECVLLRATGSGEPAAIWQHEFYRDRRDDNQKPWLTIDTRFISGFDSSKARYLHVDTTDVEDLVGHVTVVDQLPEGMPLYAHRLAVLPPIEAVFAFGSAKIEAWLQLNGWDREIRYNPNFVGRDLVEQYRRVWVDEFPLYWDDPDVYAVLGGWHFPHTEDDWYELARERLLCLTFKDSEPWVEAWEAADGTLHAIQRIT